MVAALLVAAPVVAQDTTDGTASTHESVVPAPGRPSILPNRWQEDWSVLADPAVPRKPGDALKYVPFGPGGTHYLTFGATLRERLESNDAPAFGIGAARDTYLLQRAQVHAGLHWGMPWLAFVQLEDARPFGKARVGPVDRNRADLRLAFVAWQGEAFGASPRHVSAGRTSRSTCNASSRCATGRTCASRSTPRGPTWNMDHGGSSAFSATPCSTATSVRSTIPRGRASAST